MSNHRELCLAWHMYSDDNRDVLLFASENPADPSTDGGAWVTGTLISTPPIHQLGPKREHHQKSDVA